ncbi:hypothetical protein [Pandoraea communis]|uniref:hypothetical protein n=1 Tax=Pandoraea communis TaxID=2508297 RepID=UPI0012422F26|nr:hypothetical protein [Pandoraea communis]
MEAIEVFTWLNKQGVQSDRGFVVQFTSRFTAEYRENGKTITLDIEDGMSGGLPCISVSPNAFERWRDGTAVSKNEQDQLFQNLKEAIEFQGLKLVIEKGESPHGYSR